MVDCLQRGQHLWSRNRLSIIALIVVNVGVCKSLFFPLQKKREILNYSNMLYFLEIDKLTFIADDQAPVN